MAAMLLASAASAGNAVPDHWMVGVTVTDPWRTAAVVEALAALPRRPTARIVFDEFVPASAYGDIPGRIHAVAHVMGGILDSAYVARYSVERYDRRVNEYVRRFADDVDIWEIGNEVNGEWLGDPEAVVRKITVAYDAVRGRHSRTALTLYYNETCSEKPANRMFEWAQRNIPQRIKDGVDYVFVSYYEDDCEGPPPDWEAVFRQLGDMFPGASLGIGECGTTKASRKAALIQRCYGMRIDHPRFIGGYFWWYFNEDMVPRGRPLWRLLEQVQQHRPRAQGKSRSPGRERLYRHRERTRLSGATRRRPRCSPSP
jgi:hypothetical protein